MLGSLRIQAELYCPLHQAAHNTPRVLPAFNTRVNTAREARRNIVDTLKRHIPALRPFPNLQVSFQLASSEKSAYIGAKDARESSKRAYEAAIVSHIAAGTVLCLKVLPLRDNQDLPALCFCSSRASASASTSGPTPASISSASSSKAKSSTVKPNTPSKESYASKSDLAQAGFKTTPTPASIPASSAAKGKPSTVKPSTMSKENNASKSNSAQAEVKATTEDAQTNAALAKEKVQLAIDAAKQTLVVARVAHLEAELKTLQNKYAAATANVTATTATESHLTPRFQSFCTDLLKNLNASMSANFGDQSGSFSFSPSTPATPVEVNSQPAARKMCCKPAQSTANKSPDATPAQAPRVSGANKLVGPKVTPGPGENFYCDICRRFCKDEARYRCLRCDDWDACNNCADFGHLHEHGHSTFVYIPNKDNALQPPPSFGKSCSVCKTTPSDGDFYRKVLMYGGRQSNREDKSHMCSSCFNSNDHFKRSDYVRIQWASTSSPLAHSRPAHLFEKALVIRQNFMYDCDFCLKGISPRESRYHCASCSVYDACVSCYDSCKVDMHAHKSWIEFAPNIPAADARRETPSVSATTKPVQLHNASCDLCDKSIVGARIKCLDCPDWDSCSQCVGLIPTQHPGHRFVRIEDPAQLRKYEFQAANMAQQQQHARKADFYCDGCDSPISGTRFACIGCPDFDLCAQCEALPVGRPAQAKTITTMATALSHQLQCGSHHLFVKIPAHVKVATRSGGEGSGMLRATIEEVRRSVYKIHGPTPKETAVHETGPRMSAHEIVLNGAQWAALRRDLQTSGAERSPPAAAASASSATLLAPEPCHIALGFQEALRMLGSTSPSTTPLAPSAGASQGGAAASASSSSASASASDLLKEVFQQSAKLPQSPVRDQSLGSDGKKERPACRVEYSMESPKNLQLSYEEKRVLSRRVEKGGSAAVDAFLSVLTPEQAEEQTLDGDLIFDMDDLSMAQYCDVMEELDALEASVEGSQTPAAETTAPVKEEEETEQAATPEQPAQMSELSSSFKTIRSPSAPISTPATYPNLTDVVKQEYEEKAPQDDKRLELDAEFVEDVSLPDGTVVAAGSRFDKVWLIRNSGTKAWPVNVGLKFVAGDSMGLATTAGSACSNMTSSPSAGMLPPGAECQVRLSALKAMDFGGRSTSYFRLTAVNTLGQSVAFGHQLWIDVDVRVGDEGASPVVADTSSFAAAAAATVVDSQSAAAATSEQQQTTGLAESTSTGRLGGSSVLTAPHAPESVRSDATSNNGKGKMLRGFRLSDDSDDSDEDDDQEEQGGGQGQKKDRNPFEDAILDVSDDEDDEEAFDDSDFELVDPTTEESDLE
ncbi:unnamed protein product [Tilletia controversa]|nr:unnamed protein product [Tilletia controversa]